MAGTIGNQTLGKIEYNKPALMTHKLIGFHTVSGRDYEGDVLKSIRSIAPIIDTSNCEMATANQHPDTFEEIKVLIIAGTTLTKTRDLNFTLVIDGDFDLDDCTYEVTISPSDYVTIEYDTVDELWKAHVDSTGMIVGTTYNYEMTITPTHALAAYNYDAPWGPFPLSVSYLCDPFEDGCYTLAESGLPHSFTYCDSTLEPDLNWKDIIKFHDVNFPPSPSEVVCIFTNKTISPILTETQLLRVDSNEQWEAYVDSNWEPYVDVQANI